LISFTYKDIAKSDNCIQHVDYIGSTHDARYIQIMQFAADYKDLYNEQNNKPYDRMLFRKAENEVDKEAVKLFFATPFTINKFRC